MNSCAIGSWNFANAGNAYSTSSVTSSARAVDMDTIPASRIDPNIVAALFIASSYPGGEAWLSFDTGHRDAFDEAPPRDQERDHERRREDGRRRRQRAVVRARFGIGEEHHAERRRREMSVGNHDQRPVQVVPVRDEREHGEGGD